MRKKLKGGRTRLKTYFIFGEGETEKCYFSALSEFLGNDYGCNYKIEAIEYKQVGTTKEKLKSTKKAILKTIYQKYYGYTEKELLGLESKIFIILDTDGSNGYTKNQINTIKNFFKNDKLIKVLFSNRDFELYILLHLEYYSGTSLDYIQMIKKYHKDFKKGITGIKIKNIHREIIKNGFDMILPKNIKNLENHHFKIGNNHIKEMLPFSEVYEIFKMNLVKK
ncbi:MAG: RloB family protein [Candidatus Gracilibacteria bacterium]